MPLAAHGKDGNGLQLEKVGHFFLSLSPCVMGKLAKLRLCLILSLKVHLISSSW